MKKTLPKKTQPKPQLVPAVVEGEVQEVTTSGVAVVGYALRLPGCSDGAGLWRVLTTGAEEVGPVPASRRALAARDDVSGVGGFLSDVEQLDGRFFRLSPAEATAMDPRQRLFLEVAYEALEHGGYGGSRLSGQRCGVFVGAGSQDYQAGSGTGEGGVYWATGASPSIPASVWLL